MLNEPASKVLVPDVMIRTRSNVADKSFMPAPVVTDIEVVKPRLPDCAHIPVVTNVRTTIPLKVNAELPLLAIKNPVLYANELTLANPSVKEDAAPLYPLVEYPLEDPI